MKDALRFCLTSYQVKTCTLGGRSVTYRAFDALDLKSPENAEFGTETVPAKHFTPLRSGQ